MNVAREMFKAIHLQILVKKSEQKKFGKSKQYGRYCKDMAVLHEREKNQQIKCCKQWDEK